MSQSQEIQHYSVEYNPVPAPTNAPPYVSSPPLTHPKAAPAPATVLQPIVIHPETEKKEPEMSKESEKAPDQRVSVERRPFSVNSARLGKLFVMLFSLTPSPVNVYCNTCRSVNLTCTEREVGPCAYPPEQEQSFP